MKRIKSIKIEQLKNYKLYWDTLNKITNGVNEGELVIIAARPGVGKTSLLMSLASHLQTYDRTEFYSLEMSQSEIVHRYQLLNLLTYLDNLWISDKSHLKISEITKSKAKFIFIDYFDFIDEKKNVITRQLKRIAKKNKCIIFLACQLNRLAENAVPTLSMLRNTGNIEQDADQVWFITKNKLIIAKNRKYLTGTIYIKFDKLRILENTEFYSQINRLNKELDKALKSDNLQYQQLVLEMIKNIQGKL